jgi:hypothetical protein
LAISFGISDSKVRKLKKGIAMKWKWQ